MSFICVHCHQSANPAIMFRGTVFCKKCGSIETITDKYIRDHYTVKPITSIKLDGEQIASRIEKIKKDVSKMGITR